MATTTGYTGTAEDYIPYNQLGDTGEVITTPDLGWTVTPDTVFTLTLPNCTEAITILEEAEYELKRLLKKTPWVPLVEGIAMAPKDNQALIEIALRSTQAALRALLKVS